MSASPPVPPLRSNWANSQPQGWILSHRGEFSITGVNSQPQGGEFSATGANSQPQGRIPSHRGEFSATGANSQ
eukprot:1189288-Prorocentrum_minimum.AAC.2